MGKDWRKYLFARVWFSSTLIILFFVSTSNVNFVSYFISPKNNYYEVYKKITRWYAKTEFLCTKSGHILKPVLVLIILNGLFFLIRNIVFMSIFNINLTFVLYLQLDNINLCLSLLHSQHVAGIEDVSAQELRDGKLKAILALFFALSRHKQAAKARAQQQQQLTDMTPNR